MPPYHISFIELRCIQVIVMALKSEEKEFHACAATMFARFVPKLTLKAKVARKLLKTLDKSVDTGSETTSSRTVSLGLLLILVKNQLKTLTETDGEGSSDEVGAILRLLLKLR